MDGTKKKGLLVRMTRLGELEKHSQRIRFILELVILLAFALYGYRRRATILEEEVVSRHADKIMLCGLWLLCLFCIFLRRIRTSGKISFFLGLLHCILVSFFTYSAMEIVTAIYGKSQTVWENIFGTSWAYPPKVRFSILMICVTMICISFLVNSFRIGSEMTAFFFIFVAIISHYVDIFRGSPLIAADLYTMNTGLNVSGEYTVVVHGRELLVFLILFFIFLLGRIGTDLWMGKHRLALFLRMIIGCGCLVFVYKTFIFSDYIENNYLSRVSYYRTSRSYRSYGFYLGFCRTIPDVLPDKPEGYSVEEAMQIAARYPSDTALPQEEPSVSQPNVIFLVNESFSDLHVLGEFESAEEEMPFLRSLTENCIKGYTFSSVFGGRTANTEFEILTGHTMGFLSAGTVPFQIYFHDPQPSMASFFLDLAYGGTIAYHPFARENYGRHIAYPLLGFRDYYSLGNMPVAARKLRKYVTDECDFENVLTLLDQKREETPKPLFLYNMTMQNHSPYEKKYKDFTPFITAKTNRDYYGVNQYLSLVHVTDEAVAAFFQELEAREEPTIVLFLGDHQPNVDSGFYAEVISKDLTSEEETWLKNKVPFWIWANFEIEEQENILTSMNYMQVNLLKALQAPMTGYQKFLSDLQEQVPVINGLGYIGADGNHYDVEDKDSPYYELVHEYEILQYNCLFDVKNRIEDFYSLAE